MTVLPHIKRVPLWIYLLLLGFVTFYTYGIQIVSDMIWYMNAALNISQGKGYTTMDGSLALSRGPIFPFLIATSYKLLGASPWSAFWVVRIFCILNPLVVYLLGKKLYNKWVGFAAGLFILTSYSVNFWSYRHLDAVWPFFVIFASYMTLCGFENKKLRYFLLSGLCFGISIITKEVSILFLCIPLLLFLCIKEYRKRELVRGVIINVSIAVVVVIPWFYYLWAHGNLGFLIGRAGPLSSGGISDFGVFINHSWFIFMEYVRGLIQYFYGGRNSLFTNITIAPLLLVIWILISLKSLLGDKNSKILLLHCLPIFPVLIVAGKNDWRLGQGIYFLLLSYLGLAGIIYWLSEIIPAYRLSKIKLSTVAAIVSCGAIIVVQVIGAGKKDLGYKENLKHSALYNLLKRNKKPRMIAAPFGEPHLNASIQKLKEITSPGEHVLVDWVYAAEATYYKMDGMNNVFGLPLTWYRNDKIAYGKIPVNHSERPILIDANWSDRNYQFYIFMLFESELLKLFREKNIQYVLITPRYSLLNKYFDSNASFDLIKDTDFEGKSNWRYRIYRVIDFKPTTFRRGPFVGRRLKRAISGMREKDPERYRKLRDQLLYNIASLTAGEFDLIFGGDN